MTSVVRKFIAAIFLGLLLLCASTAISAIPSASAAVADPNPADFTNPTTGAFDLEGYLAALAAENAQSNELARTGSSNTDMAVLGVSLLVVGGATVLVSRRVRATAA
jgi:LPXTG-motif cell wall-anchored protein